MTDDTTPATKKDLQDLEARLTRDMVSKLDLAGMEERLIERMRDMQTEVLRAFHDWARPVELKLRSLTAIDERLGLLRGDPPPRPRQ